MGEAVHFVTVTGATDRNRGASSRLTFVAKQPCKVTLPSLAPSRQLGPWLGDLGWGWGAGGETPEASDHSGNCPPDGPSGKGPP